MYVKDLKEFKNPDGTYSKINFIKKAFQFIALRRFFILKNIHQPEWGRVKTFWAYIDSLWCLLRYGATWDDYFEYNFIEKSFFARKKYVTKLKSRKIQSIFNRHGSAECMFNKAEFNRQYSKFRTLRDFLFSDTVKYDDFYKFVIQCKRKIIAKPLFGSSGVGIFIPDVSDDEKVRQTYNLLHDDKNYFCEEYFIQTGVLHDINPSSVNTLRIYTLNVCGKVHIMGAFVRFGGKDSIVDNIHSGGISCMIDVPTGVICRPGVNLKGEEVLFHPATGKLICGIKIPQWDKIIQTVNDAALIHPEIGYTGWDLAVSADAVCLIEANEQGNFDLPQTAMGRGILPDYEKLIKSVQR